MTLSEVPQDWSHRFGLALTPLFEAGETENDEQHHVLLDGGYGTFALSMSDRPLWRQIKFGREASARGFGPVGFGIGAE
jgi:hypothetical protein